MEIFIENLPFVGMQIAYENGRLDLYYNRHTKQHFREKKKSAGILFLKMSHVLLAFAILAVSAGIAILVLFAEKAWSIIMKV